MGPEVHHHGEDKGGGGSLFNLKQYRSPLKRSEQVDELLCHIPLLCGWKGELRNPGEVVPDREHTAHEAELAVPATRRGLRRSDLSLIGVGQLLVEK